MKDELETAQGRIQALQERKTRLEEKLARERGVMADLQSRYTAAAQSHATGSKPKEDPADVQTLIDAQTIILDGLSSAITECDGELQPLLASIPELSRSRNAQRERDELQRITAAALHHGTEALRLHDALQVEFAAFLELERQLRDANKHGAAQRIRDAFRAKPNYFGDSVWRELKRLQPWAKRIEENKKRNPESQAASAA
jgi:chromosome segregation ATPase